MKRKELFDRTIAILVKAYQNDTLEHEQPCACAIGNMVAANNNYKIILNPDKDNVMSNSSGYTFLWLAQPYPAWTTIHAYGDMLSDVYKNSHSSVKKGVAELESTGYTIYETCSIEGAFESEKDNDDQDGYKGLMAVVDCLMRIHEAHADEVKGVKELFLKA